MRDEIVRLLGAGPGSSVTATAAITEAMVAPLSAAERSSRPSGAGMAISVPGPASAAGGVGAPPGSGFGGGTAPMASLPGSAGPVTAASPVSQIGNLTGGTQPLSALPASAAGGAAAPSFAAPMQQAVQAVPAAAPFAAPTQESARAVPTVRAGGPSIGLVVGIVGVLLGLSVAAFALFSRSVPPTSSTGGAAPGESTTATTPADAGAGGLLPVAASPKAGDAADAGAGPGADAGNSARSPAGSAPIGANGKTPSAGPPGNSKTNVDPFKGSRTGK
jgi:hypothetical protein